MLRVDMIKLCIYLFVFNLFNDFGLTFSKHVAQLVTEDKKSSNGSDVFKNSVPEDVSAGKSTIWNESESSPTNQNHKIEPEEDPTLKSFKNKVGVLGEKLKQIKSQLGLEWNQDEVFNKILLIDQSLMDLKQLSLKDLPLIIRSKVEKLEQSVENIKMTLYLLFKSKELLLYDFTGKVGYGQVSVERLEEWINQFSYNITNCKIDELPMSNITKVSEDTSFELSQIITFSNRVGWNSLPIELKNKIKHLEERVYDFVDQLSLIKDKVSDSNLKTTASPKSLEAGQISLNAEGEPNLDQLDSKINSLKEDIQSYERLTFLENNVKFLHVIQDKLEALISEIKVLENSNNTVVDLLKYKNVVKDLKNRFRNISTFFPDINSSYEEYERRLLALEHTLDYIYTILLFQSNSSFLTEAEERLSDVSAISKEIKKHPISGETKDKLKLIEERARRYGKIRKSIKNRYNDSRNAGMENNFNFHTNDLQINTTETLNILHRQFNLFRQILHQNITTYELLLIKNRTDSILQHLKLLLSSVVTNEQIQTTEQLIEEIKGFRIELSLEFKRKNLTSSEIKIPDVNLDQRENKVESQDYKLVPKVSNYMRNQFEDDHVVNKSKQIVNTETKFPMNGDLESGASIHRKMPDKSFEWVQTNPLSYVKKPTDFVENNISLITNEFKINEQNSTNTKSHSWMYSSDHPEEKNFIYESGYKDSKKIGGETHTGYVSSKPTLNNAISFDGLKGNHEHMSYDKIVPDTNSYFKKENVGAHRLVLVTPALKPELSKSVSVLGASHHVQKQSVSNQRLFAHFDDAYRYDYSDNIVRDVLPLVHSEDKKNTFIPSSFQQNNDEKINLVTSDQPQLEVTKNRWRFTNHSEEDIKNSSEMDKLEESDQERNATNDQNKNKEIDYFNKESIENIKHDLHKIGKVLSHPLNLQVLQDIRDKLLNIVFELHSLEKKNITTTQRAQIKKLKSKGMQYVGQILLVTQDHSDESQSYVINDKKNRVQEKVHDLEVYVEDLVKRISTRKDEMSYSEFVGYISDALKHLKSAKVPHKLKERLRRLKENVVNFKKNVFSHFSPQNHNQTKVKNNLSDPTTVYEKDLVTLRARVEVLHNYFIHLVDKSLVATTLTSLEELKTQADKVVKELKSINQLSGFSRDLQSKIKPLDSDLLTFINNLKLEIHKKSFGQSNTQIVTNTTNSESIKNDRKQSETLQNITNSLEILRNQLFNENSLDKILSIKVQVHHLLLEIKSFGLKVSKTELKELEKTEKEVKSLIKEVETKLTKLRVTTLSSQQIPSTERNSWTDPEIHQVEQRISSLQLFLEKLEKIGFGEPYSQSTLSHIFYQLENLILKLVEIKRQSTDESTVLHLSLLVQQARLLQDKISQTTLNPTSSELTDKPQSFIENHIKELYIHLNYLSNEMLNKLDSLGLMQISLEVHEILHDLKNLQMLKVSSWFRNHVDYLMEIANNLKNRVDWAAKSLTKDRTARFQRVFNANKEVEVKLQALTTNLDNIKKNYSSGHTRVLNVFGETNYVLSQLASLERKNTTNDVKETINESKRAASNFQKTVKKSIMMKILLPVSNIIENLISQDRKPVKKTEKGQMNEVMEMKKELLSLHRLIEEPNNNYQVYEIRNLINDIIDRLTSTIQNNVPSFLSKIIGRLVQFIKSNL